MYEVICIKNAQSGRDRHAGKSEQNGSVIVKQVATANTLLPLIKPFLLRPRPIQAGFQFQAKLNLICESQ